MYKQNGNIHQEIENSELENLLQGFEGRCEQAGERISKLEDRTVTLS